MIQISGLEKHYGAQSLFKDVTFTINKGDKIGLVGRNGSGKSTLFRILLGEVDPDEGVVAIPRDYKIGTLPQHIHFSQPTVLQEGCLALSEDEQYDHYKVEKILSGLGFSEEDMEKNPNEFSGGYQIRINLTKALIKNPDLLLLDEPTNYLDIVSQRWLEDYLKSYPGEIVIITHDRHFMDKVVNHVMGLYRQRLKKIPGQTQNFYEKIAEEDELYEKTRKNQEQAKEHLTKYINRFRASARRARQAQSRIKKLEKFDDLKQLQHESNLEFAFNYAPCPGKTFLSVAHLGFAYENGPPLFNDLSFSLEPGDRLGIIGKNGKGKSTLLNIIAGELKPNKGEINTHPSAAINHFGQTNIQRLNDALTVEQEIANANPKLDNTQVRSLCGTMMFGQDLALKKISSLSGGERSRVLLGKMLANPGNILLLDEPTNHLDQESIEGLIEGIEDFPGAVVLVSHNEMILERMVNKIVAFHRGGAEFINGDYEYFLKGWGWEEVDLKSNATAKKVIQENSSQSNNSSPKISVLSHKEKKKKKAQLVASKNSALRPYNQKIQQLEKTISDLEISVLKANDEMAAVSQSGNVDAFVELTKNVKNWEKEIEKSFSELEKNYQKVQQIEKKYEEESADLGD